jgi:hypothetical protein
MKMKNITKIFVSVCLIFISLTASAQIMEKERYIGNKDAPAITDCIHRMSMEKQDIGVKVQNNKAISVTAVYVFIEDSPYSTSPFILSAKSTSESLLADFLCMPKAAGLYRIDLADKAFSVDGDFQVQIAPFSMIPRYAYSIEEPITTLGPNGESQYSVIEHVYYGVGILSYSTQPEALLALDGGKYLPHIGVVYTEKE